MNVYPIFSYILHKCLFKFNNKSLICFRPLYALIKCTIVGDSKAHALLMDVVKKNCIAAVIGLQKTIKD